MARSSPNPVGVVLVAWCVALLAMPVAGQGAPVDFHVEEVLSHPRADGVSLSLVPAEAVEARVLYGPPGQVTGRTPLQVVGADELLLFHLDGLQPSGSYEASVLVRRPGERDFTARPPVDFRTLAAPGEPVTFGVVADTHAYAVWTKGTGLFGFQKLQRTLEHMAADASLDFVLIGGDIAMTHCSGGCAAATVDGVDIGPGTVDTQQEADLRYRLTFSDEILGPLLRAHPVALVLGNHDGEAGFGNPQGDCAQFDTTALYSRNARLAHLPNAADSYAGNRTGTAYTFRTGDVQIVVLDVMRYNASMPLGPEEWTLGAGQLAWLEETLRTSDAPFKFVFGEHLLGGSSDPEHCYWYGRGGLRATDTGETDGMFLGEQALIQEVLRQHGAQLFLSFHDHVVAMGEKLSADGSGSGVHYVIGGMAGGNAPPWAGLDWYKSQMDYDGDGLPEYESEVTGTKQKGWFRITVDGEAATLEYVQTQIHDPELDGTVLLSYTIAR